MQKDERWLWSDQDPMVWITQKAMREGVHTREQEEALCIRPEPSVLILLLWERCRAGTLEACLFACTACIGRSFEPSARAPQTLGSCRHNDANFRFRSMNRVGCYIYSKGLLGSDRIPDTCSAKCMIGMETRCAALCSY
jgi:hypothetical protein